jgi:hypothetical protein
LTRSDKKITLVVVIAAVALLTAKLVTLNAQEKGVVFYEDGSGVKFFSNGTELHFMHNITYPEYLYDNGTIYYANNLTEVNLD